MYENESTSGNKPELNLRIKSDIREDQVAVNRTRGFVNLNRFKSGRAIKRLSKVVYDRHKKIRRKKPG